MLIKLMHGPYLWNLKNTIQYKLFVVGTRCIIQYTRLKIYNVRLHGYHRVGGIQDEPNSKKMGAVLQKLFSKFGTDILISS